MSESIDSEDYFRLSNRIDLLEKLVIPLLVGKYIKYKNGGSVWYVNAVSQRVSDGVECSRIDKGIMVHKTIYLSEIMEVES